MPESARISLAVSPLISSRELPVAISKSATPVPMKSRHDGQRLVNGLSELFDPTGLVIARRALFTPGLKIFTFQKLHRDARIFLFVIDARTVVSGNEMS